MELQRLSVGMLETNCYILYTGPGGVGYIIDPGDETGRILRAVEALKLRMLGVILTHVHYDHILAAAGVCRQTEAPLLVGAGDEDALTDRQRSLIDLFDTSRRLALKADRLLHEGDTLPLGEETLTVLETPGHTPGSICLDSGELLISGDTLFARSIGRTDFPGGDFSTMHRSLQRLAALEGDRRVYPGHGEDTTLAVERRLNPYMSVNF